MHLTVSHPDPGDFRGCRVAWDILHGVKRVGGSEISELTVDLRGCPHLKPYSLACLCALSLKCTGAPELLLPEDEASAELAAHIARFGVSEFFSISPSLDLETRNTSVPIEQLEHRQSDFAERTIDVWANEIGDVSVGLENHLKTSLDEVILNALTHAESPIGCLVAGQAFPKTNVVEVCVLDLGQTIFSHLRRHPAHAHLTSDREAIEYATREAITGTQGFNRFGEPNSGVGLHDLRKFCEAGHAEMTILSGNAFIVFSGDTRPITHDFWGGFPGCLVNIRFFTENPLTEAHPQAIVEW